MPTRRSVLISLSVASCLQVLSLLLLLSGSFSTGVQTSLFVSAYLLGDALGAASTIVRSNYFSWLLPNAQHRIWRQAFLGSCSFLLPSLAITTVTQGAITAFWLFSLEWLVVMCGMTAAFWLRQTEKRIAVAMIPATLINPENLFLDGRPPDTSWQQGSLALLLSVLAMAWFFHSLRRSRLRREVDTEHSRRWPWKVTVLQQTLPKPSGSRPSNADWRHWLHLVFFESGNPRWWLPFVTTPLFFASLLLLLPKLLSNSAVATSPSLRLLAPLAIGLINTLAGLRVPTLSLSLRYPLARRTQDAVAAAASLSLVFVALLSNLAFLGLLWWEQEVLGWTNHLINLQDALGFTVVTTTTIPLLQEWAKKYSADSLALTWLVLHLFFFLSTKASLFNESQLVYTQVGAHVFLFWLETLGLLIFLLFPIFLTLFLPVRGSYLLLRNFSRLVGALLRSASGPRSIST